MEIYKDITGYEGIYQISITGKIKRFDGKILKPYLNKKNDLYLKIKLTKNSVRKAFFVHQLVAKTFIPNPQNLPEVNHIDHNPLNNSITNLNWISHSANCKDAADFRAIKKNIENSQTINFSNKKSIGEYICKHNNWN